MNHLNANNSKSIGAALTQLVNITKDGVGINIYNKISPCTQILRNINNILNHMNNSGISQVNASGMQEIEDIYQFYKVVLPEVNKLSPKSPTYPYSRSFGNNFWKNARQVISNAVQDKKDKQQYLRQIEEGAQLHKQLDIIKQTIKNLRQEQILSINRNNSYFKQIKVGFNEKYSFIQQITKPFYEEVKSMRELQNKMATLIGRKKFQNEMNLSSRCCKYFQQIQNQYKYYKARQFTQSKKDALIWGQKKIIDGNPQMQNYYYSQDLALSEVKIILKPMIDDYVKVENIFSILNQLTKYQNNHRYQMSTIQMCLQALQQIKTQIKKISSVIIESIDHHTDANNINTTSGLLKLVDSWKKFKRNKEENEQISSMNKYQKSPQNLWKNSKSEEQRQLYNKIKDQIYSEVSVQQVHQIRAKLRQQMIKQIQELGRLPWKQFNKKFNYASIESKDSTQKSITEDIIIKVFQQIVKSLNLPKNLSLCELLTQCVEEQRIVQYINKKYKKLPPSYNQSGILINYFINPSINVATIRTNNYNENRFGVNYSQKRQYQDKSILQKNINNNSQYQNQLESIKKQKQKFQDQANEYKEQLNKKKLQELTYVQQVRQNQQKIQRYLQQIKNLDSALSHSILINKQKDEKIAELQMEVNKRKKSYPAQTYNNQSIIAQLNSKINSLKQQNQELSQQYKRCIEIVINSRVMDILPGSQPTLKYIVEYLIKRKQYYKTEHYNLSVMIENFIENVNKLCKQQNKTQLIDIYNLLESLLQKDSQNIKECNQSQQKIAIDLQLIFNKIMSLKENELQKNLQQQKQRSSQLSIINRIQHYLDSINGYFDKIVHKKCRAFQFNTKMFNSLSDEQFVVGKLQEYLSFDIQEYSLLYRSSQGCKANYVTQSLQKHPNTLLLIKTKLGHTVACYSSLSYCETKDIKNRRGLLIASFSKSAYPLKPGYKPIINSPEYIIFGNQTIKINKDFNNKMLVKFDKHSIFVKEQSHASYNIVGIGNSQVQIQGFQIYQIISKKAQIVSFYNSNIFTKNQNITNDRKTTAQLLNSNKSFDPNMKSQVLPVTHRNLSSNKQLQQYQQLKQQVERYQKTIKTLQKKNEELQKQLQKYKIQNITNIQHQTNRSTLSKSQKIGTQQNQQRPKQVSQANQHILQKQEIYKKLKITQQQNQTKINKIKQYQIITSSLNKKILQLQSQLNNKQQQIKSQTQQIIKQYTQKQSQLLKKHKQTQQQLQKIKKDLQAVQLKQNKIIQQINQTQNKQQKEQQKVIEIQTNQQQQKILSKQKQQQKEHAHVHNQQQNTKQTENKHECRQIQLQKRIKQLQQQLTKYKNIEQANKQILKNYQVQQSQLPAKTKLEQSKHTGNDKLQSQVQNKADQICQQKINQVKQDIKQQSQNQQRSNNKFNKVQQEKQQQKQQKLQQNCKIPKQKQQNCDLRNQQQHGEQAKYIKHECKQQQRQQIIKNLQAQLQNYKNIPKQQANKSKPQNNNIQQNHFPDSTSLQQIIQCQIMDPMILQVQIRCKQWILTSLQQNIKKGNDINKKIKQRQTRYQAKVQENQRKLKQLDVKLSEKTIQIAKVQLQLATHKDKIKEINNSRQQLAKLNKQKQLGKEAIQKQQQQLKKLKQQIEKEKTIIRTYSQNKRKLEDQYNTKLRSTNQLAEKQKQAQLKLNAATKQLQAKNKQKQQMDNFMKNMEQNKRESAQIQRRLEQLKKQFEELNKLQSEKKAQIQKLNYQIRDLKNSKKAEEQLNKKFSEMKASYEIKEKELNKIQQRLTQLQQKQKNQRIRLEQVSNDLKRDEQTHKKKMAIFKKQQQQLNLQLSKLQANLIQKKKNYLSVGGFPNRFFVGQIIQDELDRQFIIDQLVRLYPKKIIKKTKLLFSMPLMQGLDPHNRVDQYPCYIILMKMCNTAKNNQNYIMAMYSQMSLQDNKTTVNKSNGFISSVTNRKTFHLKPQNKNNPRLTQYNQFYFVFGNSEIKFKLNSYLLQTSIGHIYRSLDTPSQMKNPQIFTGSSQQKANFIGYQIYQIIFESSY